MASDFGTEVHLSGADLRKPAEIRDMVKGAADAFGGKLDILGEIQARIHQDTSILLVCISRAKDLNGQESGQACLTA